MQPAVVVVGLALEIGGHLRVGQHEEATFAHGVDAGVLVVGDEAGLLDWQLVRRGSGLGDVAYLLATAMTPAGREAHETTLIDAYARALVAFGDDMPAPGVVLHTYACHLVYAFEAMVLTLAVGGLMPLAANLELISRTASAVERWRGFEQLFDAARSHVLHGRGDSV